MADFNVQLAEPQGAGANPLASPQYAHAGNGPLLGLMENVASVFSRGLKESAKDKAAQMEAVVVGKYTSEQDALNQALENGSMKVAEHASRSRVLYSRMLAQHPEYVEGLNKANTGFKGGTAVGYAAEESKDDRQARRNRIAEAERDGVYFPPGVDEATVDAGLKLHTQMVAARKDAEDIYKRNSENRAQSDWEKRNLQEETKTRGAQNLANIAVSQIDMMQKASSSLQLKVLSNPASLTEARQALGMQLAQVKMVLQAAAGTNPELASGYKEIFDQVGVVLQKSFDPKETADTLKAQFEAIKYKVMLAATADPEVRGAIGTVALFPNTAAANVAATRAALSAYALASTTDMENGRSVPQIVGGKEEKAVLGMAKEALKQIATGNVPEKEIAEKQAGNLLNNILLQAGEYADRFSVDPTKLTGVVDLVSSPDFLKMVEAGRVNRASLEVAKRAVELNWEKAVMGKVQEFFNTPAYGDSYSRIYSTNEKITPKDFIAIKPSATGVTFVYKDFDGTPKDKEVAQASFRKAKEAEKAVNTLVQAMAHMGGNADYAQTWEKTKGLIFPDMFKEEPKKVEGPKPKRSAAEEKMAKEVSNIDPKAPDRVYEDAVNGVMKEWERLTPEQRESFRQSIIQMWSK